MAVAVVVVAVVMKGVRTVVRTAMVRMTAVVTVVAANRTRLHCRVLYLLNYLRLPSPALMDAHRPVLLRATLATPHGSGPTSP